MDLEKCIEIIPDKLFWVCDSHPPKKQPNSFFFSTDDVTIPHIILSIFYIFTHSTQIQAKTLTLFRIRHISQFPLILDLLIWHKHTDSASSYKYYSLYVFYLIFSRTFFLLFIFLLSI